MTTNDELMEWIKRPTWHDDAACLGAPVDLWFPQAGETSTEAKRICWNECPVRQECLDEALDGHEVYYGIRGGMTGRERQVQLRLRAKATGEQR